MATLAVGGTTVFDGATLQSGAVLTSATFPAGHVLQVVSDNYNSQTEASSQVKVCDVELTTKQANSKFFYNFNSLIGGQGDSDNVEITITRSAGSTPTNTDYLPTENRGPGTQGQTNGYQYYQDVQVTSSSQANYIVRTVTSADIISSTHAKGDVLSFAAWISGGCFINRSQDRVNTETGITSLTIFEIGV
tara:strand:+ start:47 stop:619 length:573 start_codon:yes stop_codon:yes gene_type:complete